MKTTKSHVSTDTCIEKASWRFNSHIHFCMGLEVSVIHSVLLPFMEETSTSDTVTRGHSLKLQKGKSSTSVRLNYSATGLSSNFWNSLPESVVSAHSLNCFKKQLDKHCIAMKFSPSP